MLPCSSRVPLFDRSLAGRRERNKGQRRRRRNRMSQDTPNTPGSGSDPESSSAATPAAETGAPKHPAESMVDSVEQAAGDVRHAAESALDLPDFGARPEDDGGEVPDQIRLLDDVGLDVKIELGRSRMYLEDLLRLTPDSVIELDKAAGDPVDIYVNDRHVARGEVLVVNENFCVRVSEIIRNSGDD